MKAVHIGVAVVALLIPSVVHGAGIASNQNFIVMASHRTLAEDVLAKAENLRKKMAHDWLAQVLPDGVGRTIINVTISDRGDEGFFWATDDPQNSFHRVSLTTTRKRLASGLEHEITHLVFAIRFGGALPAWAQEGAASLADDQDRIGTRTHALNRYVQTGRWPDLRSMFASQRIRMDDHVAYATAMSVTRYLLTLGDKPRFVRFALMGQQQGWNKALQQYYGIRTLEQLQAAWQAWTIQTARQMAHRIDAGAPMSGGAVARLR